MIDFKIFNLSKLSVSLLFLILPLGCETEEEGVDFSSKNLVTGYLYPEVLDLEECLLDSSGLTLAVEVKGFIASREFVEYESSDHLLHEVCLLDEEDYAKSISLFDSLAIANGDTSFYEKVLPYEGSGWALATSVDSISVVLSEEYDDAHPKGVDLADVATIRAFLPSFPSQNGYVRPYWKELNKKISELTPSDCSVWGATALIGETFVKHGFSTISWISLPKNTQLRDCQVTVTYFFSDGQHLSSTKLVKL